MTDEHHLVAWFDLEVDIVEECCSLDCLAQTMHLEHLVAHLTLRSEDNAWIATGRWLDLLNIKFLEHLLAACSLL